MVGYLWKKLATTYLPISSANVLPTHILFPPKNGPKLIGCLFFPAGVRKKGLLGSNLSGIKLSGSYHWSLFLWSLAMSIAKASPALSVYDPISVVSETVIKLDLPAGGSNLRASETH